MHTGLEFNDVVIINFAGDSESTVGQWTAILHDDELDLKASRHGHRSDRVLQKPSTEQAELMALCEELKHLYVAITRARRRVIIFDSDDKRIPLFEMLGRRKLAVLADGEDLDPSTEGLDTQTNPWCVSSDQSSPRLLLASMGLTLLSANWSRDWIVRGQELMEASAFEEAAKCFRRGDDHASELRAMARALQRQEAEAEDEDLGVVGADDAAAAREMRRQTTFDAGYLFALAGEVDDACRCFDAIGEGQLTELLREAGGGT